MRLEIVLLLHILAVVKVQVLCASVITDAEDEETDECSTQYTQPLYAGEPRHKCPPWGKWQTSKCLWPASQPFSSLPNSCTSLPKKPPIPEIIKQFAQSKQLEWYSIIQNLYKLRGANSACGYCSRKIQCRQRKGGQWKRGCRFIEARLVPEQCPGQDACVIKPILGACPPPVPIPRRHHRRPHPHHVERVERSPDENAFQDAINLDDELQRNASQGPPFWHCARNSAGSKCFCCCGWFLPNVTSGKCVRIHGDEGSEETEDIDWNENGMVDFGKEDPYDENGPLLNGHFPNLELASLKSDQYSVKKGAWLTTDVIEEPVEEGPRMERIIAPRVEDDSVQEFQEINDL